MPHNVTARATYLRELEKKRDIYDAEVLVDWARLLHAGLHQTGLNFRHETFGERNSVERVFQEVKRRI
jgi:transposase-like protein